MISVSSEDKRMIEIYPELADAFDPKLSAKQRRDRILPVIEKARRDAAWNRAQAAVKRSQADGLNTFMDWIKVAEQSPAIQRNDNSRLHTLHTAFQQGLAFFTNGTKLTSDPNQSTFDWGCVHPFVVQHDWARAFEGATDFSDGAYNLPYPRCAFEFRIAGRTIIMLAAQDEGHEEPAISHWVDCENIWFCPPDIEDAREPFLSATKQIRAICVALDAEVATHNVVRAPHKLNAKRERDGKTKLFDYCVVVLGRRSRAQELPRSTTGLSPTRKRLHFRRGHWRHYAESKTWIRWTLVGDPALGFIDHEYRL